MRYKVGDEVYIDFQKLRTFMIANNFMIAENTVYELCSKPCKIIEVDLDRQQYKLDAIYEMLWAEDTSIYSKENILKEML